MGFVAGTWNRSSRHGAGVQRVDKAMSGRLQRRLSTGGNCVARWPQISIGTTVVSKSGFLADDPLAVLVAASEPPWTETNVMSRRELIR